MTQTATATGTRMERWVLVASILGSSMAFIDGTVVNVALPTLQQAVGATAAEVQWVVESYALVMGALLLLGGALGDRVGRRRVFAIGTALFAGASVACALAPGIEWLILGRAVQGLGAAFLVPGSLALLGACIPPERRGQAIGRWSAISAATAGIGPLLGGWLVQEVSWRAIFWLNLPLAAVTLFITLRYVPESRDPGANRLDLPGAGLVTLGLAGLVFGLLEAPRFGFDHPLIIAALSVGVLLLFAFLAVETRSTAPMMPLDVFRSPTFRGVNLLTFLLYGALGGALYFLPFDLIQVHHYRPAVAGAALMPLIVLISVLSGWAGRLGDRFGARALLIAGPLMAGLGFALLALPGTSGDYWTTFFPGMTVLGLGMAGTVAPLTTTVMDAVPAERAGLASGINNTVSRAASLLAIAIFGIIVYHGFSRGLDRRLDELGVSPEVQQLLTSERRKLAAAAVPPSIPTGLRSALRAAIESSFVDAFRMVMLLSAALALGGAVCAWLLVGVTPGGTARSRPPGRSSGAGPPR